MTISPARLCALSLALMLLCAAASSFAAGERRLRLLTEDGPPFNFPGSSGPQGFTVEVVRELLARTGCQGEITFLPWPRAYDETLKKPDTVLFTITRTPDREDLFRWVGPIASLTWALFALPQSKLKLRSLDEARALSGISTYRADVREQYLRGLGFANIHSAANFENSVEMMLQGHVPAVIADTLGISHYLRQRGLPQESVENIFTLKTIDLYIAISQRSDPGLAERWQNALEEMRRDGTSERIRARWLSGK
ncbi:substrate-binding periplasmic protein [Paucidesulfovibrio longus]|uniref:substrate-binding periplasmic protein n=1 Tax=Paucidesulfovibrio longus TaxID=889 RepID=UPI0003B47936|nr:transporter substrate-binding domain-containing protein [Paucidesulfovibrio longus]